MNEKLDDEKYIKVQSQVINKKIKNAQLITFKHFVPITESQHYGHLAAETLYSNLCDSRYKTQH